MQTTKHNYYLNDIEKTLTEISKIVGVPRTTLSDRVKKSNLRVYTETIMGYKFKAVRNISKKN